MSFRILTENIIPSLFNTGESMFVNYKLDNKYEGQDQFQSNVVFLKVTVKNNEKLQKIPLVVKFQLSTNLARTELKTDFQFYNEVLMYSKLFPLLDEDKKCEDFFPKFYDGLSTIDYPEKDFLLLEDLRPQGFKLTEEPCFLDYIHLELAMKKLGKFHALTYSAKEKSPEKFYNFVSDLRETRWLEELKIILTVTTACFRRAIDPLIKEGKYVEKLSSIVSRLDEDPVKFYAELLAPIEPYAVVCHGDFCRNNMMFKYDNGVPVDVKFLDIAAARYSSPAVDIALLLLINTSKEMRLNHWDNLIKVYHEALSAAITCPNVPSLKSIQEEMRKKTLHAFIHCCYYLPLVLDEKDINVEKLLAGSPEDAAERYCAAGGSRGTKLIANIAEELLKRDCLNA